jgi:hypothetical protein
VQGQVKLDGKIYETNNEASYKRSYLPLQTGNIKGRVNSIIKEVEFEVKISDIASIIGITRTVLAFFVPLYVTIKHNVLFSKCAILKISQ